VGLSRTTFKSCFFFFFPPWWCEVHLAKSLSPTGQKHGRKIQGKNGAFVCFPTVLWAGEFPTARLEGWNQISESIIEPQIGKRGKKTKKGKRKKKKKKGKKKKRRLWSGGRQGFPERH